MSVDMDVDAFIPDSYILSENQKIDIYKRIASISSKEEMDDMRDELTDRFGNPPRSVENLLLIAYLRVLAKEVYVTDIKQKDRELEFFVLKNASYDPVKIAPFVASKKGAVKLIAGAKPCFVYRFSSGEASGGKHMLEVGLKMCDSMKELL